MDLRFSEEDEDFRREVAAWLEENLSGEFGNPSQGGDLLFHGVALRV